MQVKFLLLYLLMCYDRSIPSPLSQMKVLAVHLGNKRGFSCHEQVCTVWTKGLVATPFWKELKRSGMKQMSFTTKVPTKVQILTIPGEW